MGLLGQYFLSYLNHCKSHRFLVPFADWQHHNLWKCIDALLVVSLQNSYVVTYEFTMQRVEVSVQLGRCTENANYLILPGLCENQWAVFCKYEMQLPQSLMCAGEISRRHGGKSTDFGVRDKLISESWFWSPLVMCLWAKYSISMSLCFFINKYQS